MKQYLDFSIWLIEQSKNNRGFHYLGNGEFRYNYCSSYSIEEMFNFYLDTPLVDGTENDVIMGDKWTDFLKTCNLWK